MLVMTSLIVSFIDLKSGFFSLQWMKTPERDLLLSRWFKAVKGDFKSLFIWAFNLKGFSLGTAEPKGIVPDSSYIFVGDSIPENGYNSTFSCLIVAVYNWFFFKVDFYVVNPGLAEFNVKADVGDWSSWDISFLSNFIGFNFWSLWLGPDDPWFYNLRSLTGELESSFLKPLTTGGSCIIKFSLSELPTLKELVISTLFFLPGKPVLFWF